MIIEATCDLLKKRNPYLKNSVEELAEGAHNICNEVAKECNFVPGVDLFIKEAHKHNI